MSVWSEEKHAFLHDDPAMICSEKEWKVCATLMSYQIINIFILREESFQDLPKKIVVEQ